MITACTTEPETSDSTLPARPSAPVVSEADGSLSISWGTTARTTFYEVWYNTANSTVTATQWGDDLTETMTAVTGLDNGTGYYVWVRGKNDEGTGSYSPAAYAIPRGAFVPGSGSVWETGTYRNLFVESGRTQSQVDAKVTAAFDQLFYGSDSTQRIYYPVAPDMAYILDVYYNDVRSEGMSYGMMFCVQLDKQAEFNRLWKFAKTYMQHATGPKTGYFRWQVTPAGAELDSNSASDGEEYFAMALYFAWKRWGNGTGIFNYQAEADNIVNHMVNHRTLVGLSASDGSSENMIALGNSTGRITAKQVVFVPIGNSADFTDPSYHLPAFYELWSLWAAQDNALWGEISDESRILFRKACHPVTGLAPDYSNFDGTPKSVSWGGDHDKFRYDAFRVAMNITLDSVWWNADPWQKETWAENYMEFFESRGVSTYQALYNLDGSGAAGSHSPGLVAMNAISSMIWDDPDAELFIDELWNTGIPSGTYRYYDGCLYMFGMLVASGKYRIWGRE
jgi:oligosaccharide reducing-end xylanase